MHSLGINRSNFNFNSDLSGDVRITVDDEKGIAPTAEIWIPGEDLKHFIACWVRQRKQVALETTLYNMSDDEILGLPPT